VELDVDMRASRDRPRTAAPANPAADADAFDANDLAVVAGIVRMEPALDPLSLLAAAFRNSAYGIAIADARTNTLVAVNPAYAALSGRTAEEIGRIPITELYPPSERDALMENIELADRVGASHFESRLAHPDGSTEPVEADVRVLRDAAGAPRYRIATLRSTRRRLDTERRLAEATHRLRALAQRLEDVQESERKRMATALHEGLMQSLAGLNLGLETLKQRVAELPAGAPLCAHVDELQATVRATTLATRTALDGLHPAGLKHLGLWTMIEHVLARWSDGTGVPVVADLRERPTLAEDASLVALRALQEALTNVGRHAHATRVRVASRDEGRLVELTIEDDGIGIAPGDRDKPGALGLLGVSERLRSIGGELEVDRLRPHGTRVTLRLQRPRATATHRLRTTRER
jgi:two-component system sensor histidine kinase UhpB